MATTEEAIPIEVGLATTTSPKSYPTPSPPGYIRPAKKNLVSATPGGDTPRGAIRRGVKLPGGKKLNPRTASARDMESAAKAARAATRPAKGRGRHVAREELALGAALQRKRR